MSVHPFSRPQIHAVQYILYIANNPELYSWENFHNWILHLNYTHQQMRLIWNVVEDLSKSLDH
jgi:hypothetical protein